MRFTKNGNDTDFALDLEAIMAMEEADPAFSIVNLAQRIAECPRFTDLAKLTKAIGWEYKDFIGAGYTIEDLSEIFTECLGESGFWTSEQKQPVQAD